MSILCFDTETTGLLEEDEILQLSIVDAETEQVILNEYFRPSDYLLQRGWDEAAAVTGITPDKVSNKLSIQDPDVHANIQSIIDSASLLIGYHVMYDVQMMQKAGFDMTRVLYNDPMYSFATYYWTTHPDEKHTSKKGVERDPFLSWVDDGFGNKGQWIKLNLTKAAGYFGITDFGAHDSLNDVYATIDVWRHMNRLQYEAEERGPALDSFGSPICDNFGNVCLKDEFGFPMILPNGIAFNYVNDYTFEQLCKAEGE